MSLEPFYNPNISYEENYEKGPFGAFKEVENYTDEEGLMYDFFGHKVYLPFGIPAGPLLNSNFVEAAFKMGFDLPTYKTVRSCFHACHQLPNIVPVEVEGDLTIEKAEAGLISKEEYSHPIAITNSFGVPSKDPVEWQPDMQKAVKAAGKGQVMIASFQGTNKGEGLDSFIEDHVLTARLVKETGAKILELNTSCPNEGTTNLLCYDVDRVEKITTRIKEEIGNTPLLIKLAYFADQAVLRDFVNRVGRIVDGICTINTISAPVRKPNGEQALPGEGRLRSGVCGAPIKWAGLDMVKRIDELKQEFGLNFTLVGCGGVVEPKDFEEYRKAGADAVMSATGAMWNPLLAKEIKGL